MQRVSHHLLLLHVEERRAGRDPLQQLHGRLMGPPRGGGAAFTPPPRLPGRAAQQQRRGRRKERRRKEAEVSKKFYRRSARLREHKITNLLQQLKKGFHCKEKGRGHIFKVKNPIKAPESVATIITAESIFHKSLLSDWRCLFLVIDEQGYGKTYYAQIRGFIQDQYL
uniref:Uncharacterized protein n=1 Tax=Sphaerodactylus townsendi TaxID=933632 RepID=A0ACB8FW82_9SAUR